jgi:hypothetical protein
MKVQRVRNVLFIDFRDLPYLACVALTFQTMQGTTVGDWDHACLTCDLFDVETKMGDQKHDWATGNKQDQATGNKHANHGLTYRSRGEKVRLALVGTKAVGHRATSRKLSTSWQTGRIHRR